MAHVHRTSQEIEQRDPAVTRNWRQPEMCVALAPRRSSRHSPVGASCQSSWTICRPTGRNRLGPVVVAHLHLPSPLHARRRFPVWANRNRQRRADHLATSHWAGHGGGGRERGRSVAAHPRARAGPLQALLDLLKYLWSPSQLNRQCDQISGPQTAGACS